MNTILDLVLKIVLIIIGITLFFKVGGPLPLSVVQTTTQKQTAFAVTGQGKVTSVPDLAVIDTGVQSQAATISETQANTNKVINSITEEVKKIGVDKKDIRTTYYQVNPQYDYRAGDKPIIIGYQVSSSVEIKVRDLEKVNSVIDKATSLGANQVNGLTFSLSEEKLADLQKQARQAAVKEAKDKAKSLADVSGIKLGKIINVTESNASPPTPLYNRAVALEKTDSSGTGTNVEPGSSEVVSNITISYETL